MSNLVWRHIHDLSDLVYEVSGDRPDFRVLLEATERLQKQRGRSILRFTRGYITRIAIGLRHEALAVRIGRVALRAYGPEVSPLDIYETYCAAARARGLKPWGLSAFRKAVWGRDRSSDEPMESANGEETRTA